jgi:hypothetical protein
MKRYPSLTFILCNCAYFFAFLTARMSLHLGSGRPWQHTVQQSHGTSGRAPRQSATKC